MGSGKPLSQHDRQADALPNLSAHPTGNLLGQPAIVVVLHELLPARRLVSRQNKTSVSIHIRMIHLSNQTLLSPSEVMSVLKMLPPAEATGPDTIQHTPEGAKSPAVFYKLEILPTGEFTDAAGQPIAMPSKWCWVFTGPVVFSE